MQIKSFERSYKNSILLVKDRMMNSIIITIVICKELQGLAGDNWTSTYAILLVPIS